MCCIVGRQEDWGNELSSTEPCYPHRTRLRPDRHVRRIAQPISEWQTNGCCFTGCYCLLLFVFVTRTRLGGGRDRGSGGSGDAGGAPGFPARQGRPRWWAQLSSAFNSAAEGIQVPSHKLLAAAKPSPHGGARRDQILAGSLAAWL